jgi:signal transduction histidine kinase
VSKEFAEVNVDQHRIVQILVNLLSNAIKFSEADTQVRLVADLDEDVLRMSVEDNGPGIPLEDQQKLFARQLALQPASSERRLALGLPICKLLVEAHGGVLAVQSTLGKGSTFTVELPLKRIDVADLS